MTDDPELDKLLERIKSGEVKPVVSEEELLAILRAGKKPEHTMIAGLDLASMDLSGLDMSELSYLQCNFAGATMKA
jgi:hypothetical protein